MNPFQRSEWKLHILAARKRRGYFIEYEIENLHRPAARQPPLAQLADYRSLVQDVPSPFHRRSLFPKISRSASLPIPGFVMNHTAFASILFLRARELEFIEGRDRATAAPIFGHAQGCRSRSPASSTSCTIVYGSRFAGQSSMASHQTLKCRFTRFSLPNGNSTSQPRFKARIIRSGIRFTISTAWRRDRPPDCSFPTR